MRKVRPALGLLISAFIAQGAMAQTAPTAVSDASGYVAACPVVIDPISGDPMFCPPGGSVANAGGGGSLAFGSAQAAGIYSIAIGNGADVGASNSVAIGARALVINAATNSVAIGADSVANAPNTVSVGGLSMGGVMTQRRLVNVANGTAFSDAVTVSQLEQTTFGEASWLGGGATITKDVNGNGNYTLNAPAFVLHAPGAMGSYNNVGSALGALDNGLSALYSTVNNLPPSGTGPQGPAGSQGAAGPQGPAGSGSNALAVQYDSSQRDSVTLDGANGTQIHNLAAGTAATDAANVGQLDADTANAIATAKGYTDTTAAKTLQSANDYTDWRLGQLNDRFNQQDTRINRAGAVASAMGLMAGTAASLQNADVLSMAVAGYRGESAVSLGLNHHFSERVALTVGAAFGAGNEGSVGAGLAIGLH